MAIEKCIVKIVNDKVVCDVPTNKTVEERKINTNDMVKNKPKLHHLNGIGMDLTKYHPSKEHGR